MKRLDIKIGYLCNNHCLFCVQGDKRKLYKLRDKNEITQDLVRAKKNCESIVFSGGEPTLHPDFLYLVNIAKNISFQTIQVQTNGRMFSYRRFCRDTINAGANQFAPALHGHTDSLHDFLTQAPGSFNQTLQGIKNLRSLGQEVIVNTVITSHNYKYLPHITKLLIQLNVDQFQFSFVHITGTAWKNRDFIVAKKSEIIPYVRKALDIGLAAGKRVTTEAIPYCFLQGYEQCIAEQAIPETMVIENNLKIADYRKYRVTQGKKKGPLCNKCHYFAVCEGPWQEYPAIFSWSEFKPIRNFILEAASKEYEKSKR